MNKRVTLRILIVWVLMILMSGVAIAGNTYYVSPSGNDNNNGSINAPFKTIQKAANVVNPGDTVIVKDGVYTVASNVPSILEIKRGGMDGAGVIFRAENKWKAVLDGLNEDHNGIIISAPYVTIEGFEIKNIYWQGIIVQANNVTIRNNYIHNIGNWHATTNYPYCTQYGVPEPGCGSVATSGIIPDGDNILIESNIIHTIGKTGWSGKYEPGRYDHAIYGTYVNNLKIINNVIWDVWTGTAIDFAASNSIVANNTILRLTEPPSGQTTNSRLMSITGGSNQVISNNIFYGCNGHPPIYTYNSLNYSLSINNNLTSPDCPSLSSMSNKTGVTFSNNIENKSPNFTNLAERNFRLSSNSPAIDKGKTYPERTKDADGNPILNLPDIGAYEYTATSITTTDTTPPSSPENLTANPVSSSQVNLSWDPSTDNIGVAGYKIYRNGTQIAATKNTTFSDTGLLPNTTYNYTVSAYDAAGNESPKSNPVTIITPPGNSVSNITVRAKGNYAGDEWPVMEIWVDGSRINAVTVNSSTYQDYSFSFNSNSINAVDVVFINDYYDQTTGADRNLWVDYIIVNIQRFDAESPSTIYDRGYGSAAFDGINVIPGQEYMLWNGALRFRLNTLQSYDSLAPTPPSNLMSGAITSTTIILSWSPSTDNVGIAGYKIFRNGSHIATTTNTAFKDTGLSASTIYTYYIVAFDNAGNNSQPSNTISVKTLRNRKK